MSFENYVVPLAGEGADSIQLKAIYDAINKRLSNRLSRSFVSQGHEENVIVTMVAKGLSDLEHIVDEVTLARWNIVGSEHMKSEDVEGHKVVFLSDNIFKPFEDEIVGYISEQELDETAGLNVVRFL
ncbi:hypothetical protein ACV7JQ_09065 [Globicatella sulfidifaciens]